MLAQITARNCLKFMFRPSLPNHAGCQIDHLQNNAIFFIQFPFSRSKICRITPSRFPLGEPLKFMKIQVVEKHHFVETWQSCKMIIFYKKNMKIVFLNWYILWSKNYHCRNDIYQFFPKMFSILYIMFQYSNFKYFYR